MIALKLLRSSLLQKIKVQTAQTVAFLTIGVNKMNRYNNECFLRAKEKRLLSKIKKKKKIDATLQ
jgi:hypothetical protein